MASAQIASPGDALQKALEKYVGRHSEPDDTYYSFSFVHLRNSNSAEAIVYLMGRAWCGSGGCTVLVLSPVGSNYVVNSRLTVVQLPIRILNSRHNGWRDIAVRVQGGGIQPGHEARLRFNGTSYARNPTVPPARPVTHPAQGAIAISTASQLIKLFP
jgi:hypothetical protein